MYISSQIDLRYFLIADISAASVLSPQLISYAAGVVYQAVKANELCGERIAITDPRLDKHLKCAER